MTRITAPGIYEMPAADYHADPCPVPSLSASVAHILETQSALHAFTAHPHLTPPDDEAEDVTAAQEEGTALHALVLEKRDIIVVVDAKDWRKKEAQEARDAARAAGKVALLAKRAAVVRACAISAHRQIAAHKEASNAFTNGQAERVMVWQEDTAFGPIWCRSRVDWLGESYLDDLKTTAGSAHPDTWTRKMVQEGYALQAAFYLRGARALGRRPRAFRFVVLETKPPFGLTVIQPGPAHMDIAADAVERAMEAWAWSLSNDRWPGYPDRICHTEPTGWELAAHEERKITKRRGYMPSDALVLQSGMPFA